MQTSLGNSTQSINILTDVTTANLLIDGRTSEWLIGPGSGPAFGEGLKLILCECVWVYVCVCVGGWVCVCVCV